MPIQNITSLRALVWSLSKVGLTVLATIGLAACISTSNETVDGFGTPDVTECVILDGVQDGAEYAPRTATTFGTDGRTHPDVFFMGWSTLDNRSDLRFPVKGYDGSGFEDKLFVTRQDSQGGDSTTWQLLPKLTETCEDEEKIRIHSFDVAPDGRSLYLSMRRDDHARLAIYRFDINDYEFTKVTNDDSADFINPTYIGDDENTGNQMLMVAKTVTTDEFPNLYTVPAGSNLQDEYDRDRTTLIHTLDTVTGEVKLIGLNNSHQMEPVLQTLPDGQRIAIFTQWEHQQSTNRFALWKMQIDGSDGFTIYGDEARTDESGANLNQPRVVQSGPYKNYILMTQGRSNFAVDGSILMTKREHFDLRSAPVFLETLNTSGSEDLNISRNPEHYNDESFVYAHRTDKEASYTIALKDYSGSGSTATSGPTKTLFSADNLHLVHPRSYYPPTRAVTAPGEGSIGESRISFTNTALNGNAGFLTSRINQSDNGEQHQLDGIDPAELKMRFFVPSHHVSGSTTVGGRGQSNPELSVPASDFIDIESDGSFAAVLKPGMYVWKMYKRKYHLDGYVYIPVRAERQEVNFVPNRVNACNQCHQERNQDNINLYENLPATIARQKIQSNDLSGVYSNVNYDIDAAIPDFHTDIMPLLTTASATSGKSCADCHNSYDKLNLANTTGTSRETPTWTNMILGAHKLEGSENVVPYVSASINPLGFGNLNQYAPFMWSLMLGDDLADEGVSGERVISTATDFGAKYDARVVSAIADINAQYDHTQHWTREQLQTFINYSTTQTMVGLSNHINFTTNSISTNDAAAQKAFQAMIGSQGGKGSTTKCFDCHNDFNEGGISNSSFGLPFEKRFASSGSQRKTYARFIMKPHISAKGEAVWSKYSGQSDLESAFSATMNSAKERIDFANKEESELLVYARGRKMANGSNPPNRPTVDNVVAHPAIATNSDDYQALANWINGVEVTNSAPAITSGSLPTNITIQEYADPAYLKDSSIDCDTNTDASCNDLVINWSDPEGDLAQMLLNASSGSTHNVANDSMVSMSYGDRDGNNGMSAARVETYAILGDRGERDLTFRLTDGQQSVSDNVTVTVESDYDVPMPQNVLPAFEAFYVNARTGELHKLSSDANNNRVDTVVGTIQHNGTTITGLTSVYRRADQGWLHFIHQGNQRIYVVDETNANVLYTIKIHKNETYVKGDTAKQTQYLVWWRPAETVNNVAYPGMLQGILEVKLSEGNNGDWYVSLEHEVPETLDGSVEIDKTPEFLTKLKNGANTIAAYVWRRATFTVQLVQNGIDNLNALNLVTGRDKNLADYNFPAKAADAEPYIGTAFEADEYFNVRAVIVAHDGRFYGINQDLDEEPELFQFDPVAKIQQKIDDIPEWLLELLTDTGTYTAPFVYIPDNTIGGFVSGESEQVRMLRPAF